MAVMLAIVIASLGSNGTSGERPGSAIRALAARVSVQASRTLARTPWLSELATATLNRGYAGRMPASSAPL